MLNHTLSPSCQTPQFFELSIAPRVTGLYADLPGTPNDHGNMCVTDAWFACSNRAMIRALDREGSPENFRGLYHFNLTSNNTFSDLFGVYHAVDVQYIFRVAKDWWTDDDFRVSFAMQCYYAAFTRGGDPNGADGANPACAGIPAWPRYAATADRSLVFGNPLTVDTEYRKERCDVWDTIGYDKTRQ